ncbi:neuritin-like protein [Pezoporus wallicus]|uniref:neuritin-like protein n=1 Tax=Pezoporus wallicus TaxID=35540 RepID=UPI00254D13EE|nr:neuritin-like protein [Pezoporus wallicus]XP_061324825.1 neuritin-like protein [Pezoporus flaviventris]
MGGGCWRLLRALCPLLLLHLAVSQEPLSKARMCDTIYKGFASCLISLGDSMVQSVQRQQDEGAEEVQELDNICKSWDDFHTCASEVLLSCPEEAAAIWESLRQESRKNQFQVNLQELCSARGRLASTRSSPAAETNQATLQGLGTTLCPPFLAQVVLLLLVPQL